MQIDELPGVKRDDAAWWKLLAAMQVIRKLEARVVEFEGCVQRIIDTRRPEDDRWLAEAMQLVEKGKDAE